MFVIMMTVFFAWTRESRADGGLGWLETARRTNFATVVGTPTEAGASGAKPSRPPAVSRAENVDDDEHLAAYNAYLARLNQQHER
jgi:hypothetical protein